MEDIIFFLVIYTQDIKTTLQDHMKIPKNRYFIFSLYSFWNIALRFFILQFPTDIPGRFLRVGLFPNITLKNTFRDSNTMSSLQKGKTKKKYFSFFTNFYWSQGFWKNYSFYRHHLSPYSFWNLLEIRLLFQINYGNTVAYDGIQTIFSRISNKFFISSASIFNKILTWIKEDSKMVAWNPMSRSRTTANWFLCQYLGT